MLRILTSLAISAGLVATMSPSSAVEGPPVVYTVAGNVAGVVDGSVTSWRGIPYAAPPVGELRWRPPAPPEEWAGVRPADAFASPCVQLASPRTIRGSEDCLYLNVFAPSEASPVDELPVMVHLHGGSNFFGAPYENASAFVDRGVIVVTLSYRLGVFGFAGHPALTEEDGLSSGEYGVLDQIAALDWVQHNISAFGGDPANVTLFGESAGSFDAVAIAASPLSDGLFARLAAQTEADLAVNGQFITIADAEVIGSDVAQAVGCTDPDTVLPCMRTTPAEQLVVAAGPGDVAPWVGGYVLPDEPLELIASDATPVPMLVGSNREEAAFWFLDWLPSGEYPSSARAHDIKNLVGAPNMQEAARLYPPSDYDSTLWATIALYSDAVYTCPMRRLALAGQLAVYRYLYTHTYENDELLATARAAHFLDEPILWHDPALVGGYEFSAAEELLSQRMSDYWTNFAKTGDPNGPGLPEWPTYGPEKEEALRLDDQIAVVNGYHVEQCEFLDATATLDAPTPWFTPAAAAGWGSQHPAWWR